MLDVCDFPIGKDDTRGSAVGIEGMVIRRKIGRAFGATTGESYGKTLIKINE